MTTVHAKRSVEYGRIVTNLLALREEVRETSHEEAEALDRMVADLTSLQLHECIAENGTLARK